MHDGLFNLYTCTWYPWHGNNGEHFFSNGGIPTAKLQRRPSTNQPCEDLGSSYGQSVVGLHPRSTVTTPMWDIRIVPVQSNISPPQRNNGSCNTYPIRSKNTCPPPTPWDHSLWNNIQPHTHTDALTCCRDHPAVHLYGKWCCSPSHPTWNLRLDNMGITQNCGATKDNVPGPYLDVYSGLAEACGIYTVVSFFSSINPALSPFHYWASLANSCLHCNKNGVIKWIAV